MMKRMKTGRARLTSVLNMVILPTGDRGVEKPSTERPHKSLAPRGGLNMHLCLPDHKSRSVVCGNTRPLYKEYSSSRLQVAIQDSPYRGNRKRRRVCVDMAAR